ncbi:MAG: PepSY domain-containing protein, partial [Candidatus Binatia bacterium]
MRGAAASRPVRLNRLDRRVHYWISAFVALPLLVIVSSGILLHLKKQWSWVQPPEQRGTGTAPAIALDEILAAARGVPGLEVNGWEDVNRIDLRPSRGLVKVWLESGWEVQVDLGTGRVLQSAYRRSD